MINLNQIRVFGIAAVAILASRLHAIGDEEHGPLTTLNVLLIIADDLNDSVQGFDGHDQSLTPHLDRLGVEGVRFKNAHANTPICGPSRASFLSGIHPLTSGLYGHRQQANHWRKNSALKDAVTFLQHFKANGYAVYGTGKIYHNGHEENSVWTDFGEPASFGPYPWDGEFKTPWGAIGWLPHPGLPESLQETWGQGFGPLSQIPEYKADPEKGVPGYRGWVIGDRAFRYESESDRDLTPDEANTKYVVELLEREHKQPFLIACGYNRPHTPLYAPEEYFNRFPLEDIELPPYLAGDIEDTPKAFQPEFGSNSGRAVGLSKFRAVQAAGGERMWKRWIQAYLACVAFVDDQVGEVLDALEKSHYANDTLVVFVGDHGYHMGEKDYLFKNSLWEESTRTPFIVRIPGRGRSGAEVEDPVSLVDLYPSLVDWCALPKDPNKSGNKLPLDGDSLTPYVLQGRPVPVKEEFEGALLAIAGDASLELNEPGAAADQHWSWRTRRYRYTLANSGEEELYDHDKDPNEWENLAHSGDYQNVKESMRAALLAAIDHKY